MPATYEPIATTTLGSNANITFSSIPGTYTDLRLVVANVTATAAVNFCLQFNGDTATNYSYTQIRGNGTAASSIRGTSVARIILDAPDNLSTSVPTMFTADLFSYAGATNKTILGTGSLDYNGSGTVNRTVGLWRNTSAITSISIFADAANLKIGTTATLYGILKA